ncbi:wax ester/triacylglycerol synthase domain-containing protein [Terrabacter sp. BE26]|uniref:wax ester/triacylglycerol synthase domain-containing protein n=1 Tax=Terrabacter sp. BE26 TaxID=2898152 RepID=UPI0035BE74EB
MDARNLRRDLDVDRDRDRDRDRASVVDRITPNDLTTLVTDRGPAPMNIGAVLVVEDGASLDPSAVQVALERRSEAVPRLRRRLRSAPAGCGRPYWADDEQFDITRHLSVVRVADDAALWPEAAAQVCRRLPRDRPLWRACWCTGLDRGRAALVIVAHHVLADGLGGVAVLGALTDGLPPERARELGTAVAPGSHDEAAVSCHSQLPSRRELAADAWRARLQALTTLKTRAGVARAGARDLGVGSGAARPRLSPRTPFNRPTGPSRRICTIEAPLSDVLAAGHRLGATLNDIVLTAVAHALARDAGVRGRPIESLVVSVPFSGRATTTTEHLGNETGVVPFRIPVDVPAAATLREVAARSRAQRNRPRAASAAPLGLAFRVLGRLGIFRWFVDHQRLVNTFVTNVRGPSEPWRFCGHAVSRVVPVAVTPGNTGVTFDVLSYAGTLGITVVSDPDVVPIPERLAAQVTEELIALVSSVG